MTEYSAHRASLHTKFVKGLRDLLAWLEPDATIPVPEHLSIVIACDTAQALADVAIGHDLPGPFTAFDGSVYVYRAFGSLSYEAVAYADGTGQSPAEQQARAWGRMHSLVFVPLTDATREA